MDRRKRVWDINFAIEVLQQRLPMEDLQILPVGGRGRKLNISKECLVLPDRHKQVTRMFNNCRYKNGAVPFHMDKNRSGIFSQGIMDLSKIKEKIVNKGRILDQKLHETQYKDRYLDSDIDNNKQKDLSTNPEVDMSGSLISSNLERTEIDKPFNSKASIDKSEYFNTISSQSDIENSISNCNGNMEISKLHFSEIDISSNLNSDEGKLKTCELSDSVVSIDENQENNTVPIKSLKSTLSVKGSGKGAVHVDSTSIHDEEKKSIALSIKEGSDIMSDEKVKIDNNIDTSFDKQVRCEGVELQENESASQSPDLRNNLSSSLTSVVEKANINEPSKRKVSKKKNCPPTKSEIDVSSSLLSSHVEALIKENKMGMSSPMTPKHYDQDRGISSSSEHDRKEIESNIIEISNNLQNKLDDCNNGFFSMQLDKSQEIVDTEKQNTSDLEILTPDNLFPRPMSSEEFDKRNRDANHNLFPLPKDSFPSLSFDEIGPFESIPGIVQKLEVQDVVINDNKPAKYSLRNSLLTSNKVDTNNVQRNVQPSVPNTLPAIPMSMTIADPTNLRGFLHFNDPRYLATLEEKDLFVVMEHIPVNALKELEELIASFGTVVFLVTELTFDESERIGLLKMNTPFECEFVVSCLDGYVWDELRMVVRRAPDFL